MKSLNPVRPGHTFIHLKTIRVEWALLCVSLLTETCLPRNKTHQHTFLCFLQARSLGRLWERCAAMPTHKSDKHHGGEAGSHTGIPSVSAIWKRFLGLPLLIGLVRKKGTTNYWSTKFGCLSTLYFGSVMSRDKYQLISKSMHCFDNSRPEAKRNSENYDPLHKFRLVFDALNDVGKRHTHTHTHTYTHTYTYTWPLPHGAFQGQCSSTGSAECIVFQHEGEPYLSYERSVIWSAVFEQLLLKLSSKCEDHIFSWLICLVDRFVWCEIVFF